MPNILNKRMMTEIEGFLAESENCVVVDFTGMSVSDAEDMRNQLRAEEMRMHVLKVSLARLAARNLGFEGGDDVFQGSSAIVWGGESIAAVARKVKDYSRGKKSPKVRGGFLEKKAVGADQVEILANLPTRPELLAQVIGTIIAPMSGLAGAMNALLSAVPSLTGALEDKIKEGEAEQG